MKVTFRFPDPRTCQLIIFLCNSSVSSILSPSVHFVFESCSVIYHATFFKLQCMLKEAQANKQVMPSGTLFPSCWIMDSSVLLFLTTRYKIWFSFSQQPSPLLSFMTVLFSHFCSCKTIEDCCLDYKENQILPSPLCCTLAFIAVSQSSHSYLSTSWTTTWQSWPSSKKILQENCLFNHSNTYLNVFICKWW